MFSTSRTLYAWIVAALSTALLLTLVGVTFSVLGIDSIASTTGWASVVSGVLALTLVAADLRRALRERRRVRSAS